MIAVLIFLIFSWVPGAGAVNYQEFGIEERIRQGNEAKLFAASQAQTGGASQQEEQTITQQLAIITGDEDTKYIIVPGDTLQVAYNDRGSKVVNIYQVNKEGMISMPLIGAVKVTGLNRGQARASLSAAMMEYIRNPQLTIQINTAGKYTVLGAAGPGVYELRPNLKLMEAIIKAGFDQDRANLANVLVFRQGRDKPMVLRLNIKKMMLKGDTGDNIDLKPNDLIYVPSTFLHDLTVIKDRLFEYITEYYTLGGATILKPGATKGF